VIIVPTGELTGLLSDVIPFASAEAEYPSINAVRLYWDGDMLHTQATDRHMAGWAQWSPDDAPATEHDQQESLFERWGGADGPWSLVMPLADAKDVVKNYKLGAKEWGVPLKVDVDFTRIRIMRDRDDGHSALTQIINCALDKFPDIEEIINPGTSAVPTTEVAYDPRRLASLVKVRQRGPVRMTLGGTNGVTRIAIGNRFVGALMPARVGDGSHDEAGSV
jgi:hypothetical protein